MKRKTLGLALFIALLIFMGCENPTDSTAGDGQGDPIKIAVVGPHTGSLEEFGIPTLRAAELIAASVNSDSGVLGRQIEIVAIDDECSSASSPGAAQEALDAGVVGVIGHICSGATAAAFEVYDSTGIPVLSPSSTRASLTTDGDPFFFRTIASDAEITNAMIEIVAAESATNIYILHDNTGSYWNTAAIDDVEAQITAEATHTGTLGIDFSVASEVSSAATTIAGSAANGVLVLPDAGGGQGAAAAAVVNALRDATFAGPVAITNDAYEEALITDLDSPSDVYVVDGVDVLATDAAVAFNQEHADDFSGEDGGPFFINGGAALEVLLAAIEETQSTAAAGLVSAIEGGTFTTVLGELSFTDGEPTGGKTGYEKYEIAAGAFAAYPQ